MLTYLIHKNFQILSQDYVCEGKVKIGIVCYPTVGGSGILATELGHELAKNGHEVHFITYAIPFRLRLEEENIYFHEVTINQYDLFQYPDYALTLAVKIASVAQSHDLDILHVHYAIPHATSAYLAKQILDTKGRPAVITTLHGTDITLVGADPAYYQIVKFSIEHSCAVTAVSHSLREHTQEYFCIKSPIEVIHNFFTPKSEYFNDKPHRSHYVKDNEKLLVHASNYRPLKRVGDVLKIFVEVKKEVPCKLLLIGSGPDLGSVRNEVNELNLNDEVFFLGATREADSYIASGDLFLLPSEQESFGLVALESMAYGIPVVASNVGGLPEVIEDGISGILAPCGDVQAMAEKAIQILTDEKAYSSMSEAAGTRAKEKFSAETIVPQYEELYRRVIECSAKKS